MPGVGPAWGHQGGIQLRRRLLSIVGAGGLVAGLISSAVAAQASTPGPDSTYNALVATYTWSSQNVCYANSGVVTPGDGTCTITQGPSATRNIAVCVQVTSTAQQCDITQANVSSNNYALVIQRISQQGTTISCSTTHPCKSATQRASILQTDGTGSNFGGVIQKVTQSLTARPSDDDPQQVNQQDLRSLTTGVPGLKQTSDSGSNYAAVGRDSQQYQTGALAQTQTARQFAGFSETGDGINQTTATPGGSKGVLGQVQRQNLQSQVATTKNQNAYQDGDITQTGGTVSTNFASGNQFQEQREQGVSTTVQHQFGDPRCCSVQTIGTFLVLQVTNQFANNAALRQQSERLEGNCDSPPNGCTLTQIAILNGAPFQPGDPCRQQASCHTTVVCATGSDVTQGCHVVPVSTRPQLTVRLAAPSTARSVLT